jgi:hypothetical protein
VFHGPIAYRLALTEVLLSPGGEKLSPECAQWCAELVMSRRPYYVGDRNELREFPRDSAQGIVKSLSHCHSVTQGLIREKDQMQRSLDWMKLALKCLGALNAFLAAVLALLKFLH